jgi:hypothetical protein
LQSMTGRGGGGIFVAVSPALVRLSLSVLSRSVLCVYACVCICARVHVVCVFVRACMYVRALEFRPSLATPPRNTHIHTHFLSLALNALTHTQSLTHACMHARTHAFLRK